MNQLQPIDARFRSAITNRSTLMGLSAIALFLLFQIVWFRWRPVDDAFISFRFARNLAEGHGLVFNIGDRVEGYTNFLWTVLLAGASWLGCDFRITSMILGYAFAVLTILVTFKLASRVAVERNCSPDVPWICVLLISAHPGWAHWAASGMEGTLLSFLCISFLFVGCGESRKLTAIVLAGLLGSLAAMTRWEAALLWPIPIICQLFDHSRTRSARALCALALASVLFATFGMYFFWRYRYYGELLPNTFQAKVDSNDLDRIARGVRYFGKLAVTWLLPLTGLIWILRKPGRWTCVITSALIIHALYIVWTGGDFYPWHRFNLPAVPLCALMAACMIDDVTRRIADGQTRKWLCVPATSLFAITVCTIAYKIDYQDALDHRRLAIEWKAVGDWARTSLTRNETLAIAPIGCVGYYSEHPILDVLGLTDRVIAREGEFDATEMTGHQRGHVSYVLSRKPEIVLGDALVFDHEPTEEEARGLTRRKTLTRLFDSPEFKQQYQYEVAHYQGYWIPFWRRIAS